MARPICSGVGTAAPSGERGGGSGPVDARSLAAAAAPPASAAAWERASPLPCPLPDAEVSDLSVLSSAAEARTLHAGSGDVKKVSSILGVGYVYTCRTTPAHLSLHVRTVLCCGRSRRVDALHRERLGVERAAGADEHDGAGACSTPHRMAAA